MRNIARLVTLSLVFTLVSLASFAGADEKDKEQLLTRSIYVPVEFELCEHLSDAVIYQGEQALSLLPTKRIFQFTYYPTLGRIEPTRTDVRVEGLRDNGEEFIGRLAVTPWGIFSSNYKVELDLQKQLHRMRYKLDVRYKARKIRLRCADSCEIHPEAVTAHAGDATTSR